MERLKALVDEYVRAEGITKDDLADQLGIGRNAFYRRLAGQNSWLLEEAVKLSGLLGITVDELAELASTH